MARKKTLYPVRFTLYLSEKMNEDVESECDELGKTKVQFIRDLVINYFKRKKEKADYKDDLKTKIEVMILRLEIKNKNGCINDEDQGKYEGLKEVLNLIDEL